MQFTPNHGHRLMIWLANEGMINSIQHVHVHAVNVLESVVARSGIYGFEKVRKLDKINNFIVAYPGLSV